MGSAEIHVGGIDCIDSDSSSFTSNFAKSQQSSDEEKKPAPAIVIGKLNKTKKKANKSRFQDPVSAARRSLISDRIEEARNTFHGNGMING